uniref:Uncharacterized protein n=1 Tax=Photinus pyralis TaxID=7054 RepID=A0A1Y1KT23_PHOPY
MENHGNTITYTFPWHQATIDKGSLDIKIENLFLFINIAIAQKMVCTPRLQNVFGVPKEVFASAYTSATTYCLGTPNNYFATLVYTCILLMLKHHELCSVLKTLSHSIV